MTKLCLNMIVKNEAANIERCLRSVADHIGCWVIGDTGSTDDTRKLIWEFFGSRGIPGELHCFAFKTFEQARNQALDLARASPLNFDYLLFADADMELTVADRDFARTLTAEAYQVRQEAGIGYWNTRLLRRDAQARYVGVTHEYLDLRAGETRQLDTIAYVDHASGANRPGKFARDAALLSQALENEPDPGLRARYTFYLANSLRDDGNHAGALESYLERARLGHWQEEVFVSLLNAAEMKIALGQPSEEVLATFEEASAACSTRAEALHGASRYCRDRGLHEQGYSFAARGVLIPPPRDALFSADWIYTYGLLDELAVHAYWTGRYAESLAACDRLLAQSTLPPDFRARVSKNRTFAIDKSRETTADRDDDHQERGPLKIAVYTIALNEVAHVDRWARSAEAADYRIVADTGSTDGTIGRLRDLGVDVYRIKIDPWRFDDARNAALALVPGDADVCISLDMDNFMQPGWRSALEARWTPGTTRLDHRLQINFNPDGSPRTEFDSARIHSRTHYRWRRAVHEELFPVGRLEVRNKAPDVVMSEIQDPSKDSRRSYLPLLELAIEEDPSDSQMTFWLGRELLWDKQALRAASVFENFLKLPTSTWGPERSEAMIYLSQAQPDRRGEWLERAMIETPYRREVWLELAEYYHDRRDWPSLLFACTSGLEKARRTGSYLDKETAWGPRLLDLGALACWHLGMRKRSIEWGEAAIELAPDDQRLRNNLVVYKKDAGI